VARRAQAVMPAPSADVAPSYVAPSYKAQKRRVIDCFERDYLVKLMSEHQGNVSRAAQTAGKERRDLGKLLKRHGINPRHFALGAGPAETTSWTASGVAHA